MSPPSLELLFELGGCSGAPSAVSFISSSADWRALLTRLVTSTSVFEPIGTPDMGVWMGATSSVEGVGELSIGCSIRVFIEFSTGVSISAVTSSVVFDTSSSAPDSFSDSDADSSSSDWLQDSLASDWSGPESGPDVSVSDSDSDSDSLSDSDSEMIGTFLLLSRPGILTSRTFVGGATVGKSGNT